MTELDGILTGVTQQDVLNILNDGIYDSSACGRYDIVKEFRFPTFKRTWTEPEPQFEDCVVNIILWGRWEFYKWAYLSIVSAYKNTDLSRFKVRMFVRKDSESVNKISMIKSLFEPLGVEVREENFRFKYSVISLQEERYQIVLDADTLLINGKYPVFENLYRLMKEYPGFYSAAPDESWYSSQRINICHENTDLGESSTVKSYWEENGNLGFSGTSLSDMLDKNLTDWSWNIFYGFDREIFNDPSWELHRKECEEINWWDDEGAFQLYLWSKGVKIEFIRDLFDISVPTRNAMDYNDFNIRETYPDVDAFEIPSLSYINGIDHRFTILHPTNWSWMLDKEIMIPLFTKIISDSSEEFKLFGPPNLI